jgi:hypothetical protein
MKLRSEMWSDKVVRYACARTIMRQAKNMSNMPTERELRELRGIHVLEQSGCFRNCL